MSITPLPSDMAGRLVAENTAARAIVHHFCLPHSSQLPGVGKVILPYVRYFGACSRRVQGND